MVGKVTRLQPKAPPKPEPYPLEVRFQRAVAGLAAIDPRFWGRIGRDVDPGALSDRTAELVFSAVRAIATGGGAPPRNPSLVIQRLRTWHGDGRVSAEELEAARDLVLDALEMPPPPATAEQMLGELKEAIQHRVRRGALDKALSAYGHGTGLNDAIRALQRAESVGLADLSLGQRLDASAVAPLQTFRKLPRLSTGVPELDAEMSGGILRQSYTVIQGRTNGGKSMLLGHLWTHAAVEGVFGGYATLEVSPDLISAQSVANLVGLPTLEIIQSESVWAEATRRLALLDAGGWIQGIGVVRYFSPRATTVEDLEHWMEEEEAAAGRPMELLCVDYGSLLGDRSKKVRHEEIEAAAEKLRDLAMRRDMWIVTPAQVNVDKKHAREIPTNEDGAGSKGISRTADTIIGIAYDEETEMLECAVTKMRGGRAGGRTGPIPADFALGRACVVQRPGWPDFAAMGPPSPDKPGGW